MNFEEYLNESSRHFNNKNEIDEEIIDKKLDKLLKLIKKIKKLDDESTLLTDTKNILKDNKINIIANALKDRLDVEELIKLFSSDEKTQISEKLFYSQHVSISTDAVIKYLISV